MSTRDEYVTEKKQQLDEWSAQMDELEAKALKEKKAAKRKYQKQLAALRLKRAENEKKLEALKGTASESWELLKAEIENLWNAFGDSVNQFKMHFK